MPWTAESANSFKKGLSRKQRKKWASIANGALISCKESGGSDCEARAIKIANSKFTEFNPVVTGEMGDRIREEVKLGNGHKKFQFRKVTPKDPFDGHTHEAAFDEDGNGGTSAAGEPSHTYSVYGFKVQPYYWQDMHTGESYNSVHPGSLAFKKKENEPAKPELAELGECEMEIFRPGTHNGDDYSEDDLEEIAANFQKLKNEIKPSLKITHRENQETLGGLARYGDVVDVFLKNAADGTRRLFAKVANIPKQVLEWIKDRRFPERSIEIYPEFKLGTDDKIPPFKNVLKAIALLGHEMPAVPGMEPVKLEECLECQGTLCFREAMEDTEAQEAIKTAEMVIQFQSLMDFESRLLKIKTGGGEQ